MAKKLTEIIAEGNTGTKKIQHDKIRDKIAKEMFSAIATLTQDINKVNKRIDGIVSAISKCKSIKGK